MPIGSLSRTIDLLDRDGLITKDGRGPITDLDWEGVIRRWAKDYDVTSTNQVPDRRRRDPSCVER